MGGRGTSSLNHVVALHHAVVVATDDTEPNLELTDANDLLELAQGDEEDGGRIFTRLAARHLIVEEDETVDLAASEEDEHETAQGDGSSVELLAEVLEVDGQKLSRAKIDHGVAHFIAAAQLLSLVVDLEGGRNVGEMGVVLLLGEFALGGGWAKRGTRGAIHASCAAVSMSLSEENLTAVSAVAVEVVEEGRVANGRELLG